MTSAAILLAIDLSEASATMVQHISEWFKELKLTASLIHVSRSYPEDRTTSGNAEQEAQQQMERMMKVFASNSIALGQTIVKVGNIAENIIASASLLQAGLIIIGAGKKATVNRHMTGTTAETVARHASQSVMVHKTSVYSGIKKVLCGIDMSEHSSTALTKAIKTCWKTGATLEILHAINVSNTKSLENDNCKWKEHLMIKTKADVDAYLSGFDLKGLDRKTTIVFGPASKAILNSAAEIQADLIVIGARGNINLKHVPMGSTAEKVLRASPCSLLIAR